MKDVEKLDELVSSFDFRKHMYICGGYVLIRIDEMRSRKYSFRELRVLPYLQRAFRREEDLTVGALENRIKRSKSYYKASRILTDALGLTKDKNVYETVLKKLDRDEIIELRHPLCNPSTRIKKGKKYVQARVKKVVGYFTDRSSGNNM